MLELTCSRSRSLIQIQKANNAAVQVAFVCIQMSWTRKRRAKLALIKQIRYVVLVVVEWMKDWNHSWASSVRSAWDYQPGQLNFLSILIRHGTRRLVSNEIKISSSSSIVWLKYFSISQKSISIGHIRFGIFSSRGVKINLLILWHLCSNQLSTEPNNLDKDATRVTIKI